MGESGHSSRHVNLLCLKCLVCKVSPFINKYYNYVFVCMSDGWGSKDKFVGSVLPFHFNVVSRVSNSGHQAGSASTSTHSAISPAKVGFIKELSSEGVATVPVRFWPDTCQPLPSPHCDSSPIIDS